MKKSIIILLNCLAVIFTTLLISSCDKTNTVDPMNQASVAFTYSPNPIVKNIPTTFTFTVSDGMSMMTDVTNYTCSYKPMMALSSTNLTLARTATGTYSGTCTFKDADSVMFTFNCMYSMSNLTKNFNCVVK
ncbi:MAG: hypothetical protein NT007_04675 [Candidatus Kapabacteria bacterium]|nr:hypothetical protein [Candidatus Kapabacteria bacterium]